MLYQELQQDTKYVSEVPTYFPRSLYLGVSTVTAALFLITPSSLTSVLLDGNITGALAKTVFILAISVLWLDFLINDVLPDNCTWKFARTWRWLAVSLVSIGYMIFAVLGAMHQVSREEEGTWVLPIFYSFLSLWGMWFAFYAKLRRYRFVIDSQRGDL